METSPLIYFANPVGRVIDDPQGFGRLIYQPGPRQTEDFRGFLSHVIRLLASRRGGRLLIDQSQMQPFTTEEQAYMVEEWLPHMVADGGYRYGSVLVADNVFARLATATVITAARGLHLTYQYFEREGDAVAWLLQQPT
ncbi:hypothetical protein HER32_03075 [Hymenobacter sp. BT18]|uniref:STAS/SEC14 domain-containing protein n=1 Tax=Hymenobacter sp. BT18 TaxID=2835648 RepID=UPI00143EADB2|nr:STAS/SEC14 domain-containing protein [Hymenobacter sp. BT18]QIX60225.1 hypothetical protein HER32_03075 [Hymenobacter sp. BT18]